MSDFYITLSSVCKAFPDNTASEFRTRLVEPLHLTEPYQVAVIDIPFLKNIDNFPLKKTDRAINVFSTDGLGVINKIGQTHIPEEHYHKEGLLREINSRLQAVSAPDVEDTPSFTLEKNYVHFHVGRTKTGLYVFVDMSKQISALLGFSQKLDLTTKDLVGNKPMSDATVKACQYLYLYCDLINSHLMGEQFLPVLRVIGIPSEVKAHELCSLQFYHPMYFPVSRSYIHDITVTLRTRTGDLIPFKDGFTILVLHFKPA